MKFLEDSASFTTGVVKPAALRNHRNALTRLRARLAPARTVAGACSSSRTGARIRVQSGSLGRGASGVLPDGRSSAPSPRGRPAGAGRPSAPRSRRGGRPCRGAGSRSARSRSRTARRHIAAVARLTSGDGTGEGRHPDAQQAGCPGALREQLGVRQHVGPPMSTAPVRWSSAKASTMARSTSLTAIGWTLCSSQLGTGCTSSSVASWRITSNEVEPAPITTPARSESTEQRSSAASASTSSTSRREAMCRESSSAGRPARARRGTPRGVRRCRAPRPERPRRPARSRSSNERSSSECTR